MPLLSPRNDAVFKMLFTREPRLLQSMLEAVLDVEITSLQVLNPEIPGDLSGDKSIVLDVRVLLSTGTRVHVEMQVRVTQELRPRLVYYLARDFAQQLPRGGNYEDLADDSRRLVGPKPLAGNHAVSQRVCAARPPKR